jgi:UDP-2,3-diacylglucosamine hydrolase
MHAIFLADAHLRDPGDDNYLKIMEFLATLPGRVDTLFILGDFFQFWIGYPTVAFSRYLPVTDALRRLVDQGVAIVYLEGNHDFHMGPFFHDALRADIHPGPVTVTLDGRRLYLCHGDQIDRRDYGTRCLRALLHSPLTRWLTRLVPPAVADRIAIWLSSRSKGTRYREEQRQVTPDLLRRFARQQFDAGADVVITGHFHLPLLEEHDGHTLLCLGDWLSHFTYGEWRDGRLTLHRFH